MNTANYRAFCAFLAFGSGFTLLGVTSAYVVSRLNLTAAVDPDALAYCEAARHGWLRQPANALANLAFFWVGAAAFVGLGARTETPTASPDEFVSQRRGYAGACACVGMGSLLFHATMAEWAGFVDNFAMNLIATQMLVYTWARAFRWSVARSAAVLVVLNILLDTLVVTHNLGKVVFGVVVATSILTELALVMRPSVLYRVAVCLGSTVHRGTRDARLLAASIFVFLPGAVVWQHSRTGAPWCLPQSWAQGHAFWHLTSAVAVLLNYLYLFGEATSRSVEDVTPEAAVSELAGSFVAADAE